LLDPESERELSAYPERLAEIVRASPSDDPIVIDEVQRVPELLPVVHRLIESDKRRFVLTGSSARKLRRAGQDLLGGRAVLRALHPVWAADDPADVLRGYAALYVREEVKQEGLVRNSGDFSRFLEAISFSHGSQLNVTNVARECSVERRTVANFVEILYDLLIAFPLPAFRRRAKRQVVQHPKFYFVDPGVFRALRPSGPLDRPEEIGGAALEGLVLQMIRAHISYRNVGEDLYCWRTRHGLEVDCIIYGPGKIEAVEIKNSARVRDEDERGLRAFLSDFPEAQATLVYRGSQSLQRSGIHWVPAEQFLPNLGTFLAR